MSETIEPHRLVNGEGTQVVMALKWWMNPPWSWALRALYYFGGEKLVRKAIRRGVTFKAVER